MAKAKKTETQILKMTTGRLTMCLRGSTPLIMNRMSEKTRQGLLLPKGRKTAAEKAAALKHYPLDEYRGSMYTLREKGETFLGMPASAFKRAMAQAAIDVEGMKRTEVGRLSWCIGTEIGIYGVPELLMSVTRSADANKTPDIRTRAILPEWAVTITMAYVQPKLNDTLVANLMAAAGMIVGIGDWRQEKGSGSFGQFELVEPKDADFKRIMKHGGYDAQKAAFDAPEMYDDESKELYMWWHEEAKRRGKLPSAPASQ